MSFDIEKLEKQLNVVSVLFMASSGLCLLGLLFIPIHYTMMQSMMNIDFPHQDNGPNPREIFDHMRETMWLMYGVMGVFFLILGAVLLSTGINLYRKKHKRFCIVGSAMICICIPWGTALGIWSLILLFDQKTPVLFEEPLSDADFLA